MKRVSRDLILSEPNALNPIRRINELKFKNEDVKESSFIKWELKKILQELDYKKNNLLQLQFYPKIHPRKKYKIF
ncbi:hypothetical protein DNK57_01515 [Methanothermobacter thermautotrophicus]|uniref:Uncharacterized protein n=1 Tax=Methanothermobacter thermautotrophicus TaxID=145262 RepID=A0A842YKY2_METTF|nr:hypothetical protein [Methanothermobacter thermautotrophicus]